MHHYALETLPALADNQKCFDDDEDGEEGINEQGLGHMTDKPFKTGRKYIESGYVHDMTDTKDDDHYFVKAHVWPSMRSDYPHNVTVVLSVCSGAVIYASCYPCKASALGRCSHVVAVLLSIVDQVTLHGSRSTTPCTSQECTRNKGKKRKKNPQRISDAKYRTKRKKVPN